jgi:hypothetical protein
MALPKDKPKRRFFNGPPAGFKQPTHDKRVYHEFAPGESSSVFTSPAATRLWPDRMMRNVLETYNRPEATKLLNKLSEIKRQGPLRARRTSRPIPRNEPTALSVSDELGKYFGDNPRDPRPPLRPHTREGGGGGTYVDETYLSRFRQKQPGWRPGRMRDEEGNLLMPDPYIPSPEAKGPRGTKKGTRMHKEREALFEKRRQEIAAKEARKQQDREVNQAHEDQLRKNRVRDMIRIWEGKFNPDWRGLGEKEKLEMLPTHPKSNLYPKG